jgi:hypothetical protein
MTTPAKGMLTSYMPGPAILAKVKVDKETGEVNLLKYGPPMMWEKRLIRRWRRGKLKAELFRGRLRLNGRYDTNADGAIRNPEFRLI